MGDFLSRNAWLKLCGCLTIFQICFAVVMRSAVSLPGSVQDPLLVLGNVGAPLFLVFLGMAASRLRAAWRDKDPNPSRVLFSTEMAAPCAISVLASIHLGAFITAKPTLGASTHFHADPVLAAIDLAIFGDDPWRIINSLLGPLMRPLDILYSTWFVVLMFTLAFAAVRQRRQAVEAFFLIWTVGMLSQFVLPSGGPIFFERNGFGAQFADIVPSSLTLEGSQLLWDAHIGKSVSVAAGISAWPSLHVALATWVALFWRHTFAYLWAFLIALGSVGLGWHYATDGIAGALIAFICWNFCGHPQAAQSLVNIPSTFTR